jgi:hypothetical protein
MKDNAVPEDTTLMRLTRLNWSIIFIFISLPANPIFLSDYFTIDTWTYYNSSYGQSRSSNLDATRSCKNMTSGQIIFSCTCLVEPKPNFPFKNTLSLLAQYFECHMPLVCDVVVLVVDHTKLSS